MPMDTMAGNTGPTPAEMLVVAQAGCTAMPIAATSRMPTLVADAERAGIHEVVSFDRAIDRVRTVRRVEPT